MEGNEKKKEEDKMIMEKEKREMRSSIEKENERMHFYSTPDLQKMGWNGMLLDLSGHIEADIRATMKRDKYEAIERKKGGERKRRKVEVKALPYFFLVTVRQSVLVHLCL